MSIDYDRLRELVGEMEQGVAATTRYTWLDLARELLRLRDGVEKERDACDLTAGACRDIGTPEHLAVAGNLATVANTLTDLLEGDNE